MFLKKWNKEFFTIPNLLSLCRIVMIPVYVTLYLKAAGPQQIRLAGGLIILSCLTDMADGKIARQYGQISNVGKILDPLADKLTQLSMILCLCRKYSVLQGLLILFLLKEVTQLFLFLAFFRKGQSLEGALPAGKLCTTVLFLSLIILLLFPGLHAAAVSFLIGIDITLLLYSLLSYLLAYFGSHTKLRDLPKDI